MAKAMYHVSASVQFFHCNGTIAITFDNEGTTKWTKHHQKTGDLNDVKIEVYEKNRNKTSRIATVNGAILNAIYKPGTVVNALATPHADDPRFTLTAKSTQAAGNTATGTVTPDASQRSAATWFIEFRVIIDGTEKFRSSTKIKFIAVAAPKPGKKTLVYLMSPSKDPDESLKHADRYFKEIGLPPKIEATLFGLSNAIASDYSIKDNEIAEIRIITHGNKIQMFSRFKDDSKDNFVTSHILETEPSTVIDNNAEKIKKKMAADARIIVTGCNIGTYPHLIKALRKRIFGNGGAEIYAPTYRVYFARLNDIVYSYFVESFYYVHNNKDAPPSEVDENQKADYVKQYAPSLKTPAQLEAQWNSEGGTYTSRRKESNVGRLYQWFNELEFYNKFGKEPDTLTADELRDTMYNHIMTEYVHPVLDNNPENYLFSRSSNAATRRVEVRAEWTVVEKYCDTKKTPSNKMICLKLSGAGAKPHYLSKGNKTSAGSDPSFSLHIPGAHQTHVIIDFAGTNTFRITGDDGAKFKIGSGPMITGDGSTKHPFPVPTSIGIYNDAGTLLDTISIRKAKDVAATMKYQDIKNVQREGAGSFYDEKYRHLRHNAYGPYDAKQHLQEPNLANHYRKET